LYPRDVENDIRAGYAPGETTDAADPSLHRPIAPPGMKVGRASARRAKPKARAPAPFRARGGPVRYAFVFFDRLVN
jgi:hypothetical protein